MTKSLRITAWLITPLVVWAGAFLLGWLGARIGGRLTWLVVGGLVGGLAGLIGWSSLILCLRNRQVRRTADAEAEDS